MGQKPRLPGSEERALWRVATRDVRRLAASRPEDDPPVPHTAIADTPVILPPAPAVPSPPVLPANAAMALSRTLDAHTRRRIERGQTGIEAHLDLHGMTVAEGHAALMAFMARAVAAQFRLVLVITGKGHQGHGILKQSLPLWLETGTVRPHLAAIAPALDRHGGEGAFYILLKRKKPL